MPVVYGAVPGAVCVTFYLDLPPPVALKAQFVCLGASIRPGILQPRRRIPGGKPAR